MGAALALTAPLRGQEATPPPAPPAAPPDAAAAAPGETLDVGTDDNSRMTVPVAISGRGPYNFIVDTGSERTVVSHELARTLALAPGPAVTVHSMTEVSRIATVRVHGLRIGERTMQEIEAPALSRANLGAVGILGVDTLQSARVVFDFERKEMTILTSQRQERRWPDDAIVVTARSRFGRLMLIDASVDGQRVYVIIDTGAQISVGNMALRHALERRHRLGPVAPVSILSVTGGRFTADYSIARLMQIGGADMRNIPIAFADVHPFRQLELLDRPAVLLGMDALRLFNRVSVDFANRRVRLIIPESSLNGATVHMATSAEAHLGR
jgi:predicted aspartyl protease